MYLENLSITSYKNIESEELDFSPLLNCFVGQNGSGKTNILDAIHYLSLTKSGVRTSDKGAVRHGDSFLMLKGRYSSNSCDKQHTISGSYTINRGKKFLQSTKEYERLSDHIGRFPAVMVSPQDVELISDTAEYRRRFINTLFSQISGEYLSSMVKYNALLANRNSLLKSTEYVEDVLEIITAQLCEVGSVIYELRREFIERLSPIVSEYYGVISGSKEQIEVIYSSELGGCTMEELMVGNGERDRYLGHTSSGVHRDDLLLTMDSYPIRGAGSQGQQKSLLLAMKLAEAKFIEQRSGKKAILLLDDVFDKLDSDRVENLVGLVAGADFGQIFITDASKVRLENIVEKFATNYKIFEVSGGSITI